MPDQEVLLVYLSIVVILYAKHLDFLYALWDVQLWPYREHPVVRTIEKQVGFPLDDLRFKEEVLNIFKDANTLLAAVIKVSDILTSK